MRQKRNIGMHTSAEEARCNILLGLLNNPRGTNKSGLAYMAYPQYNFKSPQGAAFAVAKIARQLEDEKLIHTSYTYHGSEYCGYRICLTPSGKTAALALPSALPATPAPAS